jgi:hypothetical protein
VAIIVDTAQWPVARIKWEATTDAALDDYERGTLAYLNRREPYVSITWLSRNYTSTSEQRARIAKMTGDMTPLAKQYCAFSAIISESMAFRFALSGFLLLRPLPMPYDVVKTFDEAIRLCREGAAKRGLTLPDVITPL